MRRPSTHARISNPTSSRRQTFARNAGAAAIFCAALTFVATDARAQAPQPPVAGGQPSSFVVDSSQLSSTPGATTATTSPPTTSRKPKVKKPKVAAGTPTTVDVRILDPNPLPTTTAPAFTGASVIRTGDDGIADSVWAALRKCESNGNYAINTGNGYYGAYQFAAGTWRKLGYSGLPHEAAPAVQDEAARKLQAQQGWGPWPACTRKLGLR